MTAAGVEEADEDVGERNETPAGGDGDEEAVAGDGEVNGASEMLLS